MNFDDAISAHVDWKAKLRTYLKKADKSLNPELVEKDNECSLGKWIYKEGAQYQSNEYYKSLKEEHAEFHKCAARVIQKIDEGNILEAEAMIDANSKYTELSMNVVTKIRKMRDEIQKK